MKGEYLNYMQKLRYMSFAMNKLVTTIAMQQGLTCLH